MLKKLEDMGQLDNTIVVFTTDNGAETITFPDGGVTPFKGQKGETWEGGMRAPMVIRWPGVIKPGTVKNEIFASLDWLPTFVDIAGGPKGDGLKKQIEAGSIPASSRPRSMASISATISKASRRSRRAISSSTISGATPSAVRYKNWKMYFTMSQPGPAGWIMPLDPVPLHPGSNIKRDPFEQAVGIDQKTAMSLGGALGGPVTPSSTTGTCCPSASSCGCEDLRVIQEVPAAAGSGELQPRSGHGAGQEGQGHSRERLADASEHNVTRRTPHGASAHDR